MNNKLLVGIITILVIYGLVFLIVAQIQTETMNIIINHLVFWIILAIWIFLIWRLYTREQAVAEKQLKRLKTFMFVGLVSWGILYPFFPHVWLAITGLNDWAGALFFIPIILILLFIIGIIGSLVFFIRGRIVKIEKPK